MDAMWELLWLNAFLEYCALLEDESRSASSETYDDVSSRAESEMSNDGEVVEDITRACAEGNLAVVKRLVKKENVNSIINGTTPLIAACRSNRLAVAKYLVRIGADVLKCPVYEGPGFNCPFVVACRYGTLPLVRFLLENGADKVVKLPEYGNAAIHEVLWNHKDRDGEIIKLLIAHGAQVNAEGALGRLPPLITSIRAQTDVWDGKFSVRLKQVEVLLAAGVDPSATYNLSALKLAYQIPPIFKVLIEHGADIVDSGGQAPYEWYIGDRQYRKHRVRCFEMLLEHNAGVDVPCRHAHCKTDVLTCCYRQFLRNHVSFYVKRFEEHFVRMDIAGLYCGQVPSAFYCYRGKVSLQKFQDRCQSELARMSTMKVVDSGPTFSDLLYQRKWALLRIDHLRVELCQAHFSVYGGLIHSRYVMGRLKLSLMEKAHGFFNLSELPRLPFLCVVRVLELLSVRDLKNLVAVLEPMQKISDNSSSATVEDDLKGTEDIDIAPKRESSEDRTDTEVKRSKPSVADGVPSVPAPSVYVLGQPGPSSA